MNGSWLWATVCPLGKVLMRNIHYILYFQGQARNETSRVPYYLESIWKTAVLVVVHHFFRLKNFLRSKTPPPLPTDWAENFTTTAVMLSLPPFSRQVSSNYIAEKVEACVEQ